MKTKTIAVVAFLAGAGFAPSVFAQGASLGDVLQNGATKLSAADLRAVAAGAKVTSIAANGSARNWENEASGKLVATSDGAGSAASRRGGLTQGAGSWQVDEAGRYCVEIAWPRNAEKWCRFIFKAADKFYASDSDSKPDAKVLQIDFKK